MYYISYGSNMNLDQMAARCPNTKVYGNGKLYGWKLVFNFHADIIYTGNQDDIVDVVVWKITDSKDEKRLDIYEGYPTYYVKKNITVTMESGEVLTAMVYVMNDKVKGIYPPSYTYFNCIEQGYIDNNIDVEPLYRVLDYCCDKKNWTEYNQYNGR